MDTRMSVVPFEAPQLIGQLIADRYRVDALLGCGATGAVMRCRHVWLDTDVAVKVLHPRLCGRAEPMRRFEQEARSASRLDHPNCVRVLDFGSWQAAGTGESKYLCMELLWGVELSRLLAHRLGAAFAVDVVGQMLDGLAHAHEKGIVHRDIKPQNVVVVAGGASANTVKIVDFGIAKALTGRDVVAERGVCGTPLYMSPEQATGAAIDGRADLYSVGVVLYRMLAGRLPFESPDVQRVLELHVGEPPPPLPPETPAGLRRVVERLLQKDPRDRYANAEAARAELDSAFAGSRRIATRTTDATPSRRSTGTLASEDELAPVSPASRRVPVEPEPVLGDTLPRRTHAPIRTSHAWLRPAAAAASLSCAAVLGIALSVQGGEATTTSRTGEAAVALGEAMKVERAVEPAPRSLDASALVRARRLAESPSTRVRALAAFDEALDRDPTLLDDPRVFAEVAALVRDPYLRGVGLDFVLAHFDRRGGPLLVELLNTTLMPLVPEDRERALAALAGDPDLLALVRECPFAVTCDGDQSLP